LRDFFLDQIVDNDLRAIEHVPRHLRLSFRRTPSVPRSCERVLLAPATTRGPYLS
jgi:hypothetical protein